MQLKQRTANQCSSWKSPGLVPGAVAPHPHLTGQFLLLQIPVGELAAIDWETVARWLAVYPEMPVFYKKGNNTTPFRRTLWADRSWLSALRTSPAGLG